MSNNENTQKSFLSRNKGKLIGVAVGTTATLLITAYLTRKKDEEFDEYDLVEDVYFNPAV